MVDKRTYVIAKAADALEHAHTMTSLDGVPLNIIHRDVSPQNILVTYDGEVKLVDFGIARAEQRQGETEAGQIKGKLSYMAPEQILGSAVLDHRVDVFALGAVFYELLTGKQLFTGDLLQVMEKIRSGEVPSVRTTHPDLPEHLDKVVQKCLARRLEDRYASASEVADTLARFLVTEDTLVGSRFAGRLMGTMYREEIAALAQRNSHYLTITEQDCIYGTTPGGTTVIAAAAPSDAARSGPPATDSRVTRTTFLPGPSGSGVTAAPGDTVAISPGAAAASSVRRFPPWAIGAIGASAVLVVCVALVVAMLRPSGGATLAASTPTPAGPAAPSGVAQAAPSADAGGSQTAGGARGRGKRSEHAKTPGGAGGGQAPAANAASATSPPAKGKGGFLSVGHKPPRLAAKVFIDGQDFGYSPLMAVAVSPGRHDVEVAEFQGDAKGRSMRRTVTVTPQNSESKPLVVIITFP